MAGAVGLRDVRYGYAGRQPPRRADGRVESVFHLRSVEVHRLLALRARLRGGAGHVRADHRGARLRLEGRGRDGRAVPGVRMRLLRRLRAGLPDRDADREVGDRTRPARTFRRHHLRLLRRRLLASRRRCAASNVVRMVPCKDGKANHGHSCVKGRFAWGYATHRDRIAQADAPREDHRSVARGRAGTRRSATSPREFKRIQAQHGRDAIGGDHLVALHQRGNLPGAEAGARRLRQQQRRHLRAGLPLADRLRAEARPSAPRPARRISTRSTTPTSSWSSAPTRPTAIRCSPRA